MTSMNRRNDKVSSRAAIIGAMAVTLIGFARNGGFNAYAGADRLMQ